MSSRLSNDTCDRVVFSQFVPIVRHHLAARSTSIPSKLSCAKIYNDFLALAGKALAKLRKFTLASLVLVAIFLP